MNPVDNWIVGGAMKQYAEYAFPVMLGRDFAGVTADGDEVFGMVGPIGADGAAAPGRSGSPRRRSSRRSRRR